MHRLLLILCIHALLVLLSCNTQVDLELSKSSLARTTLDKNPVQAKVKVSVKLKKYLVLYMNDLLGTENIQEIIDIMELQEFLSTKSGISRITVMGLDHNGNEAEIQVSFVTDDVLRTLSELKIPYEIVQKSGTELQVYISREFFTVFLNSFDAIRDLSVVEIFFPDKETVPKEEFSEHVAWSFSDYQPTEVVVNDIQKSMVNFSLIKGTNINSSIPDLGWKVSRSSKVQKKEFDFISVLYSDEEQLRITF